MRTSDRVAREAPGRAAAEPRSRPRVESRPHGRRNPTRTGRTLAALALAALLASATAASAHHGEPATGEDELGALGAENTGGAVSTDSASTPVAKETTAAAGWQQVAGSKWQADGDITRMASPAPGLPSPTPYDLDFYGVGFPDVSIAMNAGLSPEAAANRANTSGFAVGAQCRRDPASSGQPVPTEEVADCKRIPVIYRYRDDRDRGLVWEESWRGADQASDEGPKDPGGFVAAVTWLGPDRALAVGGTGTYPRRERELTEAELGDCLDEALEVQQAVEPELPDTSGPGGPKSLSSGDLLSWVLQGVPGWANEKIVRWANEADDRTLVLYRALEACADRARAQDDPAGDARAWLFEGGSWRELQDLPDPPGGFTGTGGDEIPDQMRALQAIDASPRPADCLATLSGQVPQVECAIAGGMQQLWHFADGSFARGYGPRLNGGAGMTCANTLGVGLLNTTCTVASSFRFRIRDIRVAPIASGGPPATWAYAVSSGCCSADRGADHPALLSLAPAGWKVSSREQNLNTGQLASNQTQIQDWILRQRQLFNPDSYYAVGLIGDFSNPQAWVLRTPGGPPERYEREPPSRFTDRFDTGGCDGEACARDRATLSSLRLVSWDGTRGLPTTGWAVGALRSSGQGVAYLDGACPAEGRGEKLVAGVDQVPTPESFWAERAGTALCALPSYALNAYRAAGKDFSTGEAGIGWAVGDHGAILTRGGGVAGREPPPARSGAKSTPQPLLRGAFEEQRAPVTQDPGTVPALVPGAHPSEPGFTEGQVAYGPSSSHQAEALVMSRDGSEGWSFSRLNSNSSTPYHYDGLRWTACDFKGIAGLIAPHPACAEAPAAVNALARVPLERDADPTNDDRFEAIAVTDSGLYRYRGGRWLKDAEATYKDGSTTKNVAGDDVAFTAPDDGWVAGANVGFSKAFVDLYHFDGEGWVKCTTWPAEPPARCGDPGRKLDIALPLSNHGGGIADLAVAGERVYLSSVRDATEGQAVQVRGQTHEPYPVVIYHDRGGPWQGGDDDSDPDADDQPGGYDGTYDPGDGGWDPGCLRRDPGTKLCVATESEDEQGRTSAISVAQDAGGSFQGWALGTFGGRESEGSDAVMMRLDGGSWRQWQLPDAANYYLRFEADGSLLTLPAETGGNNAFLFAAGDISTTFRTVADAGRAPALAFDQQAGEQGRWKAIPTPWSVNAPNFGLERRTGGDVQAIAPDGRGGFWASVESQAGGFASYFSFHHYTDRAPAEVFAETPDPTAGKAAISALGAGADGTVWLGDENGSVYRYDRLAGWSGGMQIPGWDPDRATRRAPISAIAVGPGGSGVAVGPGGRIADLGDEVRLDAAATIGCDPQRVVPPCGRGTDLQAAAVAPDGSAIVAGANRTLLWRPPSGEFRSVEGPPVPLATSIVDVEMPAPDRVYLLAEAGRGGRPASRVIRGEMGAPGQWDWTIEIGDSDGSADPLTIAPPSSFGAKHLAIEDLAVDAFGHGYAVGSSGLVLERTGDGEHPWRRVSNSERAVLRSVVLPAGGGEGALVGGEDGLLLTIIQGKLYAARHADRFDPVKGDATEVALTPGYAAGEVEAWAVRRMSASQASNDRRHTLLHYPPGSADPRLDPARGVSALSDTQASSAGEISFAALGKQDCDAASQNAAGAGPLAARESCGPPDGANITADLVNRRIREELVARSEAGAPPSFALFTGDAVDGPGGGPALSARSHLRTPLDVDVKHRRWVELVADPLAEQGVATLGAIGVQDLAGNLEACQQHVELLLKGCARPSQLGADQLGAQAGPNLPWRAAMASSPAPWEAEQVASGLRFERVGAGALSQQGPDAQTPDAGSVGTSGASSGSTSTGAIGISTEGYPLGSGDTHYAADVIDDSTGEKVARIVVVDTSMRSIAASDPLQHPIEAGGQIRWLDEMTCFEGSAEDTDGDVRDCTREPGQQAIVVSNTPTYSYGPISPEETQTDAAAFEAVLLKNQVNVVVSGRLGWNGRYWTLAPGVHAPCPGQGYRSDSEAPSISKPEICGASAVGGTQGIAPDPNQVIDELPEDAQQAASLAGRGAIPFVVSSTAGGRFNEKAVRGGFATAERGFWRGYSIVRLHPSGNPAKTIVEQRPILDWVGISANDPSVPPGERLQLQSFAREAFGMDTAPRYYEIPETQVITHRYHLLLVHPDEPWRACEASDPECEAYYSKLSTGGSGLASQQSGATGSSSAAMQDLTPSENPCEPYLCLPERVGTIDPDTGDVRAGNGKYPDTFALATLSVGEHVAAQPLVFTKSPSFIVNPAGSLAEVPPPPTETGSASAPPPPPGTPVPNVPQASVPNPPPVPPIAPLQTAEPPEPQPPAPPAPPPPSETPAPISLTLAPPGITVATPTAVIQPPTPPVNPAPPGGARREARQRQAATQKSGADSSEATDGIGELGGDRVDSRNAPGTAFTRHDHSFTRRDRVSGLALPHRAGREWRDSGSRVALQDLTPSGAREPSFTPLRQESPSASAQGLLYGSGITLLAAIAALGWTYGRPTPRRRPPEVPAPAYSRVRNHYRR